MKFMPAKRSFYLLGALCAGFVVLGAVALVKSDAWLFVALPMTILVMLIFLADLMRLLRQTDRAQFKVTRTMPRYFILQQTTEITLKLDNTFETDVELQLFDHVPETFAIDDAHERAMPIRLKIEGNGNAMITYRVKPLFRGAGVFTGVQLRVFSAAKLWKREFFLPVFDNVKTYPDFRKIDKDNLLYEGEAFPGGLRSLRKRGAGTDFEQLREYRAGDALSQLDYKATARFNKLISKDYQIERDQQVMILLDCSRRLRVLQQEHSQFDYALNTMIFLARSVLNQGDSIGMMSFGNDDMRFVPPKKGRKSISKLLNQVYNLEPSLNAPDYIRAAETFLMHQKRRSLVILITSLQEEDTETIQSMLRILQKRHLVVVANLREALLGEEMDIHHLDDAVFYAAKEDYQAYRETMLKEISNNKLVLLDTYPQDLTARLINLYLNIKQTGIF